MFFFLKNLVSFRSPRCHKGELFKYKWYNLSKNTKIVDKFYVCKQRTEIELGFYQRTGYVSYGLTIAFSIITFIIWKLSTVYSFKNIEILWWFP
ncbi:hypothetical protein SAMN05444395_10878 [Flavobacterium fryxellicola]|uniref:Uncharacterized protein n=1 Tax=Flavobacterium fryxellicola TaxID=249352 RepID=A0A167UL83_9FLAO|nr:hypothetical protein FBFR_14350 [Flavobacterium fryxellicola]SHN73978.1 hypothetical protein SAMN05444395_10878 [Flavobacterium fryxellicola]